MKELTSYERMKRMYDHKEADRIPFLDNPWNSTLERWHKEGMPENVEWQDYFGVDKAAGFGVDNSPRYESKTIEENDEYRIFTTNWGATMKDFKHSATVPEFLSFRVDSRETWNEAKERMKPSDDRIDWDKLKKNYRQWKKDGLWIGAAFWFGFDVAHSWMVGTERFLMWMVEDPELCVDIFNTYLDLDLILFQKIWDAGYKFDSIGWPDDMGYKQNQFFSLSMYRELLKPVHKRAADWGHQKGVKVSMHSCGDINPLIPELIEIGIDCLHPIEVKAGMDPIHIKKTYGDKLVLHGGINVLSYSNPDTLRAEMRRVVPEMKKGGGYIFGSDHSIPSDLSLKDMKEIVALCKEIGKY